MSHKFGFPNLVKKTTNLFSGQNKPKRKKLPVVVSVVDIIMDENHPLIKNGTYGLNSLGLVICVGTTPYNLGVNYEALPLNSNSKTYPTIGEPLTLIQGTKPNSNGIQFFYDKPLSFFGTSTPNGNQFPSITQTITPPSQNLTYDQIEQGAVNIVDNSPPDIIVSSQDNPSQATYSQKSDIHPLMPFEGDVIYEGRWGNSLRFGSTAKSLSQYKNLWSTSGNNGDPIMILRNGQPKNTLPEGWIPITENANDDLSSIYLTSYQKIPINDTYWENIESYPSNKPKSPSQYSNPQILLSSDRITINSKNDSILLRSQDSISLSSFRSLNIDTPKTVIQSNNIFLGDAKAEERGVKGDTLKIKLDIILNSLILLTRVLEVNQLWPGGLPSPDGGMLLTSSNTKTQLQKELDSLNDILSKVVKTL